MARKIGAIVALAFFLCTAMLFAGGQKESAATAAANGKITLDFWTENTQPYQVDMLKTMIAKFEAGNPNITVNYELVPWSVYLQKFQTALQTKQTPVVSQLGTTKMPFFQKANGLANIDQYVNGSDLAKGIIPAAWYTNKYDGHYFGVPWAMDVRYTLYRKDWFQKAGIAAPTSWTWQEFLNDAKKLTDAKNNVYGVGAAYGKSDNTGEQAFWSALCSAGGQVIDSNGKVVLDSPQARQALQLYVDLLTQDHVAPPSAPSLSGPDLASLFANGSIGIIYSNNVSMYAQVINAQPSLKDAVGIAPNPSINGKSADFMGGSDLVMWVGHTTPEYDAAWKWIEFLMSPAVQAEYALPLVGALPAVNDAFGNSAFLSTLPSMKSYTNVMLDAVKTGVPEPNITQLPVMESALQQMVNSAALGTSIPQAIQTASQAISAALGM